MNAALHGRFCVVAKTRFTNREGAILQAYFNQDALRRRPAGNGDVAGRDSKAGGARNVGMRVVAVMAGDFVLGQNLRPHHPELLAVVRKHDAPAAQTAFLLHDLLNELVGQIHVGYDEIVRLDEGDDLGDGKQVLPFFHKLKRLELWSEIWRPAKFRRHDGVNIVQTVQRPAKQSHFDFMAQARKIADARLSFDGVEYADRVVAFPGDKRVEKIEGRHFRRRFRTLLLT